MFRILTTVTIIGMTGLSLTRADETAKEARPSRSNGTAGQSVRSDRSSLRQATRQISEDLPIPSSPSSEFSAEPARAPTTEPEHAPADATGPATIAWPEEAPTITAESRRLLEFIPPRYYVHVLAGRHKVMRARSNVYRTFVADPEVCDVVQYSRRDVSITGLQAGSTEVTFWLRDRSRPVTYRVDVQERFDAPGGGTSRRATTRNSFQRASSRRASGFGAGY